MKDYDVVLIPGKYTGKISIPDKVMKKLPEKIILFGSVQFLNQLPDVQKQLENGGKTVIMHKSKNYLYEGLTTDKGQLLGCNMENFSVKEGAGEFDAFLYIGDGVFHPKALLVNNEKDVYCYDPKIDKLAILDKKLHKEYSRRVQGAKLKFLNSKNIGLLMTTKMGQGSPKRAMRLKQKIIEKLMEEAAEADQMAKVLNISPTELLTKLSMLELRGVVRQEDGKYFLTSSNIF